MVKHNSVLEVELSLNMTHDCQAFIFYYEALQLYVQFIEGGEEDGHSDSEEVELREEDIHSDSEGIELREDTNDDSLQLLEKVTALLALLL